MTTAHRRSRFGSGEAEIDSQRGGERLEAGQTMNARGPASDPEFQIVQAIPPDSLGSF